MADVSIFFARRRRVKLKSLPILFAIVFSLCTAPQERAFSPSLLDETDLTTPAGAGAIAVSRVGRRKSVVEPLLNRARWWASVPLKVQRRIQRRLWTSKLERFHLDHRETFADLDECVSLQQRVVKVFGDGDPFLPAWSKVIRKGEALRDGELAKLMREEDFGGWSPPVDVMDWYVDFLLTERPRTVLEFGGGRSTACLCTILTRIHGPNGFRVLTLDQEQENVDRTLGRLSGLEGRESCRIVHVPLVPAKVGSRQTSAYDVASVDPRHFEWLGEADFVFVDGPYAEGPCRYGTLPAVRGRLAPGARFVMDDALREKEMFAGRLWAREGIQIDGILTLGQGVMRGSIV